MAEYKTKQAIMWKQGGWFNEKKRITDMENKLLPVWIMLLTLLFIQTMSNIESIKNRNRYDMDVLFLNQRIDDLKRTHDWFNEIHTNTIAVVSDYMRQRAANEAARRIGEQLLEIIQPGFETNVFTGVVGDQRFVSGVLVGIETNDVEVRP